MANLSGYTAIYIRTTGNDTTGDGSSGSPYATAQKGFAIAAATASGNYVLDFGVGSFGGVTLTQNWPSRVAIRGAGGSQSFLGGIVGSGANEVYDYENLEQISAPTNGFSISLVSDLSVDAGAIESNGGDHVSETSTTTTTSGSVTLVDTLSGAITSTGGGASLFGTGDGGDGGAVTLTGSISGPITTNGRDGSAYGGPGGSAGAVTLTDSTSGNIDAVAGAGNLYSNGSDGSVTLSGSTTIPNVIHGIVTTTNLRKGRGVNGSSILGIA